VAERLKNHFGEKRSYQTKTDQKSWPVFPFSNKVFLVILDFYDVFNIIYL
jgi:hypothetical protein